MRSAVGGRGDGEETGGCVDAIQHGDTFEAAEGGISERPTREQAVETSRGQKRQSQR